MRLLLVAVLALTACTAEPGPEVAAPQKTVERAALSGDRALVLADQYPPTLLVDEDGRWSDVTPKGLADGTVLHDVAVADGRAWAVSGDCAMTDATLWTSDDGARSWDERDLPALAHCSAGSYLRLLDVHDDDAVLDVSVGALQQVYRKRTRDGGRTWTDLRCRYERPRQPSSPCDG